MATNSTSFVNASGSHGFCFMSTTNFNPNNMDPPDSVYPTYTILATVNGLASLPTVVLNGLIIWTVFRDEDLRSSTFNMLLSCLAGTDFLVGLLSDPMYSLSLGCMIRGCYSPCRLTIYVFVLLTCSGLTMAILMAACVERYLAIEHPNFYLKYITRKKVMVTTIVSCVATLVFLIGGTAFLNKTYPGLTKIPVVITISVHALVILYCSVKVQLTAYRQSRAIAIQQESVQQPDEQQQQEQRFKEYKKVFMMTIIVGLSVLFYTPFMIVAVIEAVGGVDVTSDFKYIAGAICVTLLQLQSLINPIIMSLRLSYIRQAIKENLSFFTGN